MTKEKIKDILTISTSIFMLVVVIGISYSAFTYSGLGKKENIITTGAISMSYTESSNTISITNALPQQITLEKQEKLVVSILILQLNHLSVEIPILTMK